MKQFKGQPIAAILSHHMQNLESNIGQAYITQDNAMRKSKDYIKRNIKLWLNVKPCDKRIESILNNLETYCYDELNSPLFLDKFLHSYIQDFKKAV